VSVKRRRYRREVEDDDHPLSDLDLDDNFDPEVSSITIIAINIVV